MKPQRGGRTLVEPELYVRVVLDEPEIVLTGLLRKAGAALFADGAPGRIGKGRHDVGKACARGLLADGVGVEPLVIGGDFNELRVVQAEGRKGAQVRRILDEHLGAGIEERAGDKIKGLLGARNDLDFLGRGRNAVGRFACRDQGAQLGLALGERVLKGVRAVVVHDPGACSLHIGDGKTLGAGQAASEADDFGTVGELEKFPDDGAL